MKRFLSLFVLAAGLLAGCATAPGGGITIGGNTPKVAAFQLQGAYRTALIPVATYVELPRCSPTVRMPCSESALVVQLQKATKVAELAVDAADSVAYTPGATQDAASLAIAAAQAALQALTALTPTQGAKP